MARSHPAGGVPSRRRTPTDVLQRITPTGRGFTFEPSVDTRHIGRTLLGQCMSDADAAVGDAEVGVDLDFGDDGLVPAVAQDAETGEVLMLAYATREALSRTLETGRAHYYSRSRDELWEKGGTSGHTQTVREIRVDCDGDALLYRVEQAGGA